MLTIPYFGVNLSKFTKIKLQGAFVLDSTGFHFPREIPCFLCAKTRLKYDRYTPEHGHCGENLSVGSCMSPHRDIRDESIGNLKGARFYILAPYNQEVTDGSMISPTETKLCISSEPYHYRGYQEPDFGTKISQTIFVCKVCVEYYAEDIVKRILDIFKLEINRRYAEILNHLFLEGVFTASPQAIKKRWKKIESSRKTIIQEDLSSLLKELDGLVPTEGHLKIKRRLKQFSQATS